MLDDQIKDYKEDFPNDNFTNMISTINFYHMYFHSTDKKKFETFSSMTDEHAQSPLALF